MHNAKSNAYGLQEGRLACRLDSPPIYCRHMECAMLGDGARHVGRWSTPCWEMEHELVSYVVMCKEKPILLRTAKEISIKHWSTSRETKSGGEVFFNFLFLWWRKLQHAGCNRRVNIQLQNFSTMSRLSHLLVRKTCMYDKTISILSNYVTAEKMCFEFHGSR